MTGGSTLSKGILTSPVPRINLKSGVVYASKLLPWSLSRYERQCGNVLQISFPENIV
jgi:hypothetical protein